MGRRAAVMAVSCAALLAGSSAAYAQYFGRNKVHYDRLEFRRLETEHFDVYYYEEEEEATRQAARMAERWYWRYSSLLDHAFTARQPLILYASHAHFAQTNLTPEIIEQNTGGFTEALRNRVVLPFTGSYEDLRHVVVHELVHAFMFDLLYGSSAAALIARQSFFSVPLWFGEGLAEYFSLGMESNAEMFLRDGTIAGYLPPLPYTGGYFVYKQGQSALSFFVDRYGGLEVERSLGGRYTPDLVEVDAGGRPRFWGECGSVSMRKAAWLAKHSGAEELAFVKIRATEATRAEILRLVELSRGRVVDVADGSIIAEVTGTEAEIDAFAGLVRTYGIKELVRTGAVVMARGSGSIEEAIKR